MSSIETIAYRHEKKEGMFLFIRHNLAWQTLPDPLQQQFAHKSEVTRFVMTPTRKLARADSATVWQALNDQGYYLQMPPSDPNAQQVAEDEWIAAQEASKQPKT